MTIPVKTLNPAEIQSAVAKTDQIVSAATPTVTSNTFVFFAAFDGTRNNKDDTRDSSGKLSLSGDPLATNVAQTWQQVHDGNKGNQRAGG